MGGQAANVPYLLPAWLANRPGRPGQEVTTAGKATGLRFPALSTARTPNCTLSLAISSVTVVTATGF